MLISGLEAVPVSTRIVSTLTNLPQRNTSTMQQMPIRELASTQPQPDPKATYMESTKREDSCL